MSAEPLSAGSRYTMPTLVEVHGKTINLCYMILKEEKGPGQRGAIDLTLETGRMIHLEGDDADRVRKRLRELLAGDPPHGGQTPTKTVKGAAPRRPADGG